jgi:hypothetical protein
VHAFGTEQTDTVRLRRGAGVSPASLRLTIMGTGAVLAIFRKIPRPYAIYCVGSERIDSAVPGRNTWDHIDLVQTAT